MNHLKALRQKMGVSQQVVADYLEITRQAYSNYENGNRDPDNETLLKLGEFFDTSVDVILRGEEKTPTDGERELPSNIIPMPEMRKIPLIGTIACGAPILAEEHIEEMVSIPKHIPADFALRCKGDSMINARIFDGDIVYIRQQDMVENGEIAAVLIESEATLKRVRLFDDHIVLEPENPQYRPISIWGEEMNTVRILGKAVAFTSTIR